MAFWTNARLQDPKRSYRFLVTLAGMENGAQWYCKSASKPEISFSTIEHNYLNHRFYYPGRAEWSEVTVTLVDPVDPDAAANTAKIIQSSGYNPPKSANDTTTISKKKAVDALNTVVISQIDDEGQAIESWTLRNAFIIGVTYGDLDYSSDDMTEITLSIRYDFAELQAGSDKFFDLGSA